MDRGNYEDRHPHDRKKAARDLWRKIFDNLSDRSCFRGIDPDVMEELEEDLVGLISRELTNVNQQQKQEG
jgi:hypothetical protein